MKTPAAKPLPKPKRANIITAMNGIFEPWFRGASWNGWKSVLKAMDALPMTASEIEFFKSIAGGREPPAKRVSELVAVTARRTGKDSVASLAGAYGSATFDQQDKLRPGERSRSSKDRPELHPQLFHGHPRLEGDGAAANRVRI
jgi:hypothetical protein